MAIDDLKVVIKNELTSLRVRLPSGQSYSREQMVLLLSNELFAKGKVKRKDSGKVITKDNLVLVNWAGQKIYLDIFIATGTNTTPEVMMSLDELNINCTCTAYRFDCNNIKEHFDTPVCLQNMNDFC